MKRGSLKVEQHQDPLMPLLPQILGESQSDKTERKPGKETRGGI